MTTSTFFGETADGYLSSSMPAYADARSGGGFGAHDTETDMYVGQSLGFNCYQSFISFDTSLIPDSDTVSAVTLSLKGTADASTTDFTVAVYAIDWGATLTTGDWASVASVNAATLVASIYSTAYSTGYMDFTSEIGFLAAINKTGSTRLVIVSDAWRLGVQPTNDELLGFATADTTGTGSDPKLVVVHGVDSLPQQRIFIPTGAVNRASTW